MIGGRLFSEQTEFHFKDSIIENINVNSKHLIKSYYQPTTFNKCTFDNIICSGDASDSYLIELDATVNKNNYQFNDLNIKNCRSNGDLIKISGDNVSIEMIGTTIEGIKAYGSVLNNNAKKVNIKFKK